MKSVSQNKHQPITVFPDLLLRLMLFLLVFITLPPMYLSADSTRPRSDEDLVLDELNRIRKQNRLQALKSDIPSATAAFLHAVELRGRQTLSHWSLDGSRVVERYRRAGGSGLSAGENLGAGESIRSIVEAWMESPSHRRNILNPDWYSAGAGIIRMEGGRIIVVTVFNNSRWNMNSCTIRNDEVVIEGDLFLSQGSIPRSVSLVMSDCKAAPLYVNKTDQNTIFLHFEFQRPRSWESEGKAAVRLYVMEDDLNRATDLFFLDIP